MPKRWIALLTTLATLSACATDDEVRQREFDLPIYYTESGVPHEFKEVGSPVTGHYSGSCKGSNHLANEAYREMVSQAQSTGADAVLIPDSVNAHGTLDPESPTCSRGYSRAQMICLCGIPYLVDPTGEAEITGLPIRYTEESSEE